MKASVSVKVPELKLVIVNQGEVVEDMTRRVAASVVRRTKAGQDARGRAMPAPKDTGGTPLNRTGSLLQSIGFVIRPAKREGQSPVGVVRPMGKRPEAEQAGIDAKVQRAKERTKALRAEAVKEAEAAVAEGRVAALKRTKKGKWLTGKIRVRAALDQSSLMAILSQPPRDKRGMAGKRAQYRVFEPAEKEIEDARREAARLIKAELREVK